MKLSNLILASVFALSFSAFAQGGEQTAPSATESKTVEKTEKAEKTTKDGKKSKMKKTKETSKKEAAPKAE